MVINSQDSDLIAGIGLISTLSVLFVGNIGSHYLPYESE